MSETIRTNDVVRVRCHDERTGTLREGLLRTEPEGAVLRYVKFDGDDDWSRPRPGTWVDCLSINGVDVPLNDPLRSDGKR